MIIENERDLAALLRTRMEACGYDPVNAYNGKEGLKTVYEQGPDLILHVNLRG